MTNALPRVSRWTRTWLVAGVVTLVLWGPSLVQAEDCTLFDQGTFPLGMVWWRVDPNRNEGAVKGLPEGSTAYLVTAVRPDGVLIQNREARYPRLLGWKVLARSELSTDGRRTWRRGCATPGAASETDR